MLNILFFVFILLSRMMVTPTLTYKLKLKYYKLNKLEEYFQSSLVKLFMICVFGDFVSIGFFCFFSHPMFCLLVWFSSPPVLVSPVQPISSLQPLQVLLIVSLVFLDLAAWFGSVWFLLSKCHLTADMSCFMCPDCLVILNVGFNRGVVLVNFVFRFFAETCVSFYEGIISSESSMFCHQLQHASTLTTSTSLGHETKERIIAIAV